MKTKCKVLYPKEVPKSANSSTKEDALVLPHNPAETEARATAELQIKLKGDGKTCKANVHGEPKNQSSIDFIKWL
ncbi:hypothetical protein E3N88_07275 [Mikania micrantha]|uniref:Uncharacterized protein n=1 Tax=Mikania micrantha TaxID=192012 RepID=A0A5N6PTZ3_9ASTR|nr:hypothetical protein E3N88_07275 [Mikania micrantha]